MRVGIDYQLARTHAPGVGRYARELVRALVRLPDVPELRLLEFGREPSVVPEAALGLEGAPAGVTRRRIALPRRARGLLARVGIGADRLLGGVDLFQHVHLGFQPASRAIQALTLSDLPPPGSPGMAALRTRTRRVDHVLVFSARYRERVRDELGVPAAHIHAVPVGCDHWLRDLGGEPVVWEQPPVVLVLGAPRPERRHAEIAQACARLAARGRDLRLRLVFSGAVPAWFASALEAASLRGRVEVQAPHEPSMARLVASASLLVHLSGDEGTAVTPLEGMILGTPVLASRCAAFEEAVGDHARLLDDEAAADPAALASAIDACLEPDDPAAAARRREHAARFTWAANAAATLRVWRAAVESRR